MELIGKKVKHATYGEGIIVEQDTSYISVKFNSVNEQKKFVYPSCFKMFLKLEDSDIASEIDEKILLQEQQEREKKEREAAEAAAREFARRMQENNGKGHKNIDIRPFATIGQFCEEYKKVLISEIMYLKTTGGKRQRVFDGKRVEFAKGRYVYTFESEDELNYPDGTQISIWRAENSIPGEIIGCEDFTVIIASTSDFGAEVPSIEFSAEPWRLLNSLIERLDEIAITPTEIVRSLVCDGFKSIDHSNRRITTGQSTAVEMSQAQPITFIWGPPGTGKTETLAKIVLKHISMGHRVLMLSYSNVSVDGATLRVHRHASDASAGTIVRYGYARHKDLLEHRFLTSYNLAIHNHPELLKERKVLIAERKMLSRTSPRYIQIGRRLTDIKKALLDEEKFTVRTAKFVATTVSKAVVDNTIRNTEFDVVIFDEASMAYIPQIIFSASLATKHFICMGDFKQLPPIVQSNATSILNADIFQYCGISSAVDNGRNHKWLCLLDTQYRMHPQIADFASIMMYGGRLKSAEQMESLRRNIVNSSPISNHAIAFADLSGMMSVCTKTGDDSRINVLSAFVSMALALEAAADHEVGIITPYRAQSRLLHAMARDVVDSDIGAHPIACATVHQFQGSEKDVIVYDAVDCYRMPFPGMLLTASGNNYANRLFNVALTRAKGKFVGVANISYLDNKNLSKNLMFERMLEQQRRKSSCLTGRQLIGSRSNIGRSEMSFYEYFTAGKQFRADLVAAKSEIRMDIPDKPTDDACLRQIAEALREAKRRGVKVVVRAENKQGLPSCLRSLAIENQFLANPVVLIDKKVIWFGMPGSEANFKSEGVVLPTAYRPIIRFVGRHTATSLYGLLEMSKTVDQCNAVVKDEQGEAVTETFASYVLAHKTCPSCGAPMRMQKSKKGKFFLSCTKYPTCSQTQFINADLVECYFRSKGRFGKHCSQCNCSLEAKDGYYGLYIQCCGLSKHKYKLDEI